MCAGLWPRWTPCSASPTSLALPLNPIRKLIGKPRVLGSGLQPRWLMGLPDLEPLIDDSRVLRWAEPHSVLLVSLMFYWAWISDRFSGNAMRDQVKKTEVLSVIKTVHGKEIRASHGLGLHIDSVWSFWRIAAVSRLVGALTFMHKVCYSYSGPSSKMSIAHASTAELPCNSHIANSYIYRCFSNLRALETSVSDL